MGARPNPNTGNRTGAGAVRCVAAAAALVRALAAGLVLAAPFAVVTAAAQTAGDIAVRDELVADQEALLNAYRCRFDVDIEQVPGGCADGAPMRPAAGPGGFEGEPDAEDIAVRDRLVADQEALLNAYRCRFDIDTEVVPGGCPDPDPEPAEELWGGGTGWAYNSRGEPVATRVWSQAETKSPWPPAGEGQFELDWMTQCMRENHEYRQERVRRGWMEESLATYEVTALSCSIHISAAWGPVVLDGRDKACVYEALMNRRVRTISVRNRAWTMWDCPTGPDGTDPDPLRPFEIRCRELVERMVAAGYERAVCVPEAVPARDPANPCNSQRFAAQWLYWAWLRAQGLDNTTKYDWRAC